MKKSKGFTLIELLVVIAIIGILATVLLVNLAGTRNSARSAAAKLEMNQLKTAIESQANPSTGAYPTTCTGDCSALNTSIVSKTTAANPGVLLSATAWCARYTLLGSAGDWCVDSTGFTGAPTAATDCAGTDYSCK